MKKIILFLTILLFSTVVQAALPDSIIWTPVGLGGGGGQFSPAISPHNDSLLFVSCDMSGVYRSTDAGDSWEMINFRQIKSSINCAPVFHPSDPNILWDESGRSLMKSTDTGITWFKIWDMPATPSDIITLMDTDTIVYLFVSFENDGIYKSIANSDFIKIPDVTGVMYLDEYEDNILAASASQLWLSSTRGDEFILLNSPSPMDNPEGIIDIAVNDGSIYVVEATKLWKSDDQGATWIIADSYENYNRGYFKFVRAEQDNVWLTTAGGGKYQPTALLSKDNAITFEPVFFCNSSWDDISNLDNGWLSLDFNCGWGGNAIGFNISSTNPEIALWTDYGRTLYSSNAGETWEALYTEYADEGERDAGKLWQSRGLEVTTSWDLFIYPDDNEFINIAYTDIGGAYSNDGGIKWRSTYGSGIPGEWFNTTYDFGWDEENNILWGAFAGRHDIPSGWSSNLWSNEGNGGVAYSEDGGMNWTPLTENGLINKPVTSVAVDYTSPANNRRLFTAVWSNGVWRSNNGGNTWERCSEGLDCADGTCTNEGPNTHVVEVQVHPDGTVFALKTKYLRDAYKIKNDAGLWRSTNHGDSWEFISDDVPECPPNASIDLNGEHSWADAISFQLDDNDVNHIYVCAQNCNNGKVQGGLYETIDGGENWQRIYQNYGTHSITKSKYYEGRIYLADIGRGLLVSDDNGSSWQEVENFPFSHPTRITEDPADSNLIWINTYGGGVWKGELIDNTTGIEDIHVTQKMSLNIYPNPFSSYVKIEAIGANSIEIYNLLGMKILEHQNDNLLFYPDNLSSGIYLIKAVYNDVCITKISVLRE
ncbi:T9SS type A sorting domain-containing protein [Bacteroidota bacterium]